MTRNTDTLTVAMIHEVFAGPQGEWNVGRRLAECRSAGVDLAVLPELPLDPWVPGARTPADANAEAPRGRRYQALSSAARATGVAVLGGAITRDPSGQRRNRALLFDRRGEHVADYDKLHIPSEPGFWESDHYEPGHEWPRRIDLGGWALGVQICSDLNRPEGSHLLGAQGVEVILAPRATPDTTYDRWLTVIRANAITSACFVVSVNRPGPEAGIPIGGPSVAVAPDGTVLAETTGPWAPVMLDRSRLEAARADYPGYLDVRGDLYARGWSSLGTE